MTRNDGHLYPIAGERSCYSTGLVSADRQVLMGLYCPDLVAIFFDANGNLLGVEKRRLSYLGPDEDVRSIDDPRITTELHAWQTALKYQPALIRVKKFFVLDERETKDPNMWTRDGIGIEDYPAGWLDILAHPERCDEDERAIVRSSLPRWDHEEQFVLWWGNDYWLDKTGEIVAS